MAAIVARLTRRRRNKDHYKEYETSKVGKCIKGQKIFFFDHFSACTSYPLLRTHFIR